MADIYFVMALSVVIAFSLGVWVGKDGIKSFFD